VGFKQRVVSGGSVELWIHEPKGNGVNHETVYSGRYDGRANVDATQSAGIGDWVRSRQTALGSAYGSEGGNGEWG